MDKIKKVYADSRYKSNDSVSNSDGPADSLQGRRGFGRVVYAYDTSLSLSLYIYIHIIYIYI